MFVMSLFRF